jgi:hypothetical protein
LPATNFKAIGGAASYSKNNFKRYSKLFVFSSGSSINDTNELNFLDLGVTKETKYYLFSKRITTNNIATLNLQQTLDLEGF